MARQLLKDVNNLASWQVENGGDGWVAENNDLFGTCFASSFLWCKKSQLIDLIALGYLASDLDRQPHIDVVDHVCSRADCGSVYQLKVELLDGNKQPLSGSAPFQYAPEGHVPAIHPNWQKVGYIFAGYGPGLRFIRFEHSGKDVKGWKGNYGAKVAGSSVTLSFVNEPVN